MKCMLIKDLLTRNIALSFASICSIFSISRCSYTNWLENCHLGPDPNEMQLRSEIQNIIIHFRYGYRRTAKELQRRGFKIGANKVLKMMREDNLLCIRKKRFKIMTTDSDHGFQIYPNLAKNMEVNTINKLWVADITYIKLHREFIYLAVIIDVFSRKCIGWELSRNIDTHLTLNALDMALNKRKHQDLTDLIHHSDRGVQYASDRYTSTLEENCIRISMSRKGNPYDNAYAESFMKTLKYEEVYLDEYDTFEDAFRNIKHFIEEVYNEKRLHSKIGYIPPNEYEKEVILNMNIP